MDWGGDEGFVVTDTRLKKRISIKLLVFNLFLYKVIHNTDANY
jgi:hypothetical protein